ncbi:MAG TPA: alanine--tRNA ligase [Baekduia sp.]|nr:alanine--tRNA ligase [Baekduia sp.]
MTSDEIREQYLSFFEGRQHRRLPSASLVPASFDASVMLTTAGMQPLMPYFLGIDSPPAAQLTSCQKCFRAVDIDQIGLTTRHLTFFEMLGNFSMGDYFKEGAIEMAFELSTQGFKFDADRIWVTVHEGDDGLGLDADEEAIELWEKIGIPRERIVLCPSSENFWQAGPTGPCGPCSELYYDRGPEWGTADDLPGGENERFLEFWNLVFMQFEQRDGGLVPLPAKNIDTGLGLNRMALIQQGVDSVFDTDQFVPLMKLGRELASSAVEDERALRILADHTRGMTFLIADGVVPSNEDRGYVLRRLMRRAIARGHSLGIEPGFLPQYVDVVKDTMGAAYPQIEAEYATIIKWVEAEEAGFGRTLEAGLSMLDEIIARGEVTGDEAFRLHDTHGFPIDLTREIAAERDVPIDLSGFETLMAAQRTRSQGGTAAGKIGAVDELIRELSPAPTQFTGYDHLAEEATIAAIGESDGQTIVKLDRSPFYAQGGGQVSDTGTIECSGGDCHATVAGVMRAGDDQAIVVELQTGTLAPGQKVNAVVDRHARRATEANHTATHLLHAALRETLGSHVRQAGSYVGPDKLRFDFTHGQRLSPEELKTIEDRVNEWIARDDRVAPQTMGLDEAKAKGAMALFGEKYGEMVRMVEIGDTGAATDDVYSRELCGGTHVASTGAISAFKITSEGSSASNVRRIEALTGAHAVALLRHNDAVLRAAADAARAQPEQLAQRIADLQAQAKSAKKSTSNGVVDTDALIATAVDVSGAKLLTAVVSGDGKALMNAANKLSDQLGSAAVVLGSTNDGKVALAASVSPALVQRGVKAGEIVRVAAQIAGGGGGGKDTLAQAGGRDPAKLPDALKAADQAIREALEA